MRWSATWVRLSPTKPDIRLLEQKLELLQSSMAIRLGSILVVAMGLLFAALKLT